METVKRSINVKHLFRKIMQRWKMILLVAIICGIAGAGYAVLKQKIEDKNLQAGQEIALTEEEFANICSVATTYDMLEAQKKYNEQSIWMKCRNLTKGIAYATYQIHADTELEMNQIAVLYTDILESNEIYDEIASEEETGGEYVKEGVFCTMPVSGMLQLEVTSYSEERAFDWLEKIDSYLDLQKKEIEKKLGISYDIKKVYKNNLQVIDVTLAEQQETLVTKLTSLQTSYDALIAALPANQLEYLTLYLQARTEENYVDGQPLIKDDQMLEESRNVIFMRRLKIDSILACVLGGFGVCVLVAFQYIYSSVLVNKEDLEVMYGLPVLGVVPENEEMIGMRNQKRKDKEGKCIDIAIKYREVIAKIGIQSKKGEKIYITGTQINSTCVESLKKEGEKQDILFTQGKNFIKEPEAMIEIKDYDAVVFLEKEGLSKYTEIEREAKICRESGKKILGVIVIC